MSAVTRGSNTDKDKIEVEWSALSGSASGGSAILSYNLQWDSGTGGSTWTDLTTLSPAYTAVTFSLTTGVTTGSSYKFRVRAYNRWGYGSYSASADLKASEAPAQMSAPTTSIDSSTGGVKIVWTAPSANGDAITEYKIEVQDKTSVWKEDTTNCEGAGTTIKNQLYCIIPMSVLTDDSGAYDLAFASTPKVRAYASNSHGASAVSASSSGGAAIRQAPGTMNDPTITSFTQTEV
jgi:hypothetical protein